MKKKITCWWSGGVTSAVACKKAIEIYGVNRCVIIFMDTGNEDDDTYRFLKDCEKWYGKKINSITALGDKFQKIEDIWVHYKALNNATGAICSSTLKRDLRLEWESKNKYNHQVFGFDLDEAKRAKSMSNNHRQAKAIYPLMFFGLMKKDCIDIIKEAGIEVPRSYNMGYHNNNCFKTMCIQGGIGYWQKVRREFPDKFDKMAEMEHRLTNLKGEPVTMLKSQTKEMKKIVEDTGIKWKQLVFLKKHPDYPELKCLDDMKPQEVKPLFECNGFCGTNDFKRNETEKEINFD